MYNIITRLVKETLNLKRQVKGAMEEMSLSDKAIQRLKEYLTAQGWNAQQILNLLDYITK